MSIDLNASRIYTDNQNQQADGQVKEITYVRGDPRSAIQPFFELCDEVWGYALFHYLI